jgi:hypothetical protein
MASLRNQIHAAGRILFRDGNDLSSASHFGNPLFEGSNHAKGRSVGQTLGDHLFVARLENVQGQGSAGEQDDFEREHGKQRQGVSDAS